MSKNHSGVGHHTDESCGGYEMFRARASSEDGQQDPTWRVGFGSTFRDGLEEMIASNIMELLASSDPSDPNQDFLFDIGSGASSLNWRLKEDCGTRGWEYVVADSPEMLEHLAIEDFPHQIPGRFPETVDNLLRTFGRARAVVAYSVLQYAFRDGCADEFVSGLASVLGPGGTALIGDIPNRDKRDRRFAALGIPVPEGHQDDIRDADILRWLMDLRSSGINAYVIPHFTGDPMSPHREHILMHRPRRHER